MTDIFIKQVGGDPDRFVTRAPRPGRKIVWTSIPFQIGQRSPSHPALLSKMLHDMLVRYTPGGEVAILAARRMESADGLNHIYQAAFEIEGDPVEMRIS
jgi:hypothetical protein